MSATTDLWERAEVADRLGMVVGWVDYDFHASLGPMSPRRRIRGGGILTHIDRGPHGLSEPMLAIDLGRLCILPSEASDE
jgi:hypothetical protein